MIGEGIMSASASPENCEEIALSLGLFAKELCGGGALRADGSVFPVNEAIAEAIAAAQWARAEPHAVDSVYRRSGRQSPGYRSVRYQAYKILLDRFLREYAGPDAQPRRLLVRDHVRPQASAAALQAQPAPAAARTLGAFRRLAPIERAALLLVVLERFSYAEAASLLAMDSVSFVEALARAREALAARLASSAAPGSSHLRIVG